MNTQKKIERRKKAAKRLVAQLEADQKPIRVAYPASGSSRPWRTLGAVTSLTSHDRQRIHNELVALQA